MTSPKPAAAVDLDALKCAVDRSACTDANQWAYSDFTADFSPDVLRALIAELEQLRAGARAGTEHRCFAEGFRVACAARYQSQACTDRELACVNPYPSPPEAVKP